MKLVDIGSHIQNKGIYLGYRQILVDFAMSNTPYAYHVDEKAIAQAKEWTPEEVLIELQQKAKTKQHSICFGGGEPLLQVDYLKPLLAETLPLPTYLETNATLPKHLEEIKDKVDMFGVTLYPDFMKEFVESLSMIFDKHVFVRLIADKETTPNNVNTYAKIIAEINKEIPLIIEPLKECKQPLPLHAMAQRHLDDVRVIPAILWDKL
jgi:organic radical activating enzyme